MEGRGEEGVHNLGDDANELLAGGLLVAGAAEKRTTLTFTLKPEKPPSPITIQKNHIIHTYEPVKKTKEYLE
jgi:hypothetical protein